MKPKKKQPVMARMMRVLTPRAMSISTDFVFRALVLPATREAYDAMVEQGAKALHGQRDLDFGDVHPWERTSEDSKKTWRDDTSVILAAIGITKPASDAGREETR